MKSRPRAFLSLRLTLLALLGGGTLPVDADAPKWVDQGLVLASNMEPLSFVRRRGGQASDYADLWHADHSEAAVLALKRQGINAVLINLYKGAGLKAEAEDIDEARRYVALAHRHGLKVGGYIGGSIFYETFFAEEPDAVNWLQRDESGRPIHYTAAQTFRYMPDLNHPAYRAFIAKVIRLAITDLKMDFVHFDQATWWAIPESSHGPADQECFRQWLSERYPPDRMQRRFGYREMPGVRVPEFDEKSLALPDVRNPLLQEWVHSRTASLGARLAERSELVHQLDPGAAVMGNSFLDPARNNGVVYGVDPPQVVGAVDFIWVEGPDEPQWTADGRLVSRIRSYKAGRAANKPVIFWQQSRPDHGVRDDAIEFKDNVPLRLAEALAYNNCCLGVLSGFDLGNPTFSPDTRSYVDFFWQHAPELSGTESRAEVAVLRSFASVEFNAADVLPAVMLFEQSLIQAHVPFDLLYDQQLARLDRYKVLVLAEQDALSDEQLATIRTFVDHGGGLVVTGRTSANNEWRQPRPTPGLASLLGFNLPVATVARHEHGRGRVAYFPRVIPEVAPPPPQLRYHFGSQYWKLPSNHAELVDAVKWAAGRGLSVEIEAPEWVTAELTARPSARVQWLHLVNYKSPAPVSDVVIRFRGPLTGATLLVPGEDPRRLELRDGTMILPSLGTYALVKLELP